MKPHDFFGSHELWVLFPWPWHCHKIYNFLSLLYSPALYQKCSLPSVRVMALATFLPAHVIGTWNRNQVIIINLNTILQGFLFFYSQIILAASFCNTFISFSYFSFPQFESDRIIVGAFKVESKLLIWVWPIPTWRQPRATRVFTSKAGGPRWPDLCCSEVLISLFFPQTGQIITNVLARPWRTSSLTLLKRKWI